VGVVEQDAVIDGSKVQPGDTLLALASSGPHSNGFSLVRRILEQADNLDVKVDNKPLLDALLTPTRIYVKALLALLEQVPIHAMAHITGGGLPENLPRVLPDGVLAHIDTTSWKWPEVFQWLQREGQVENAEMYRTFNCGVGMVLVVPRTQADKTLSLLADLGETAWRLGDIREQNGRDGRVVLA
jgi:phosphoribosylformylglycinamidine cyclo-ligase